MEEHQGQIHEEHPFATPAALRDPVRRLRGRLTAPVTIVTSGTASVPAGLTVSSVMVAEGEPPLVYCLIGPTTDVFDAMAETGRFIIHVCEEVHRVDADVFAGVRPSPGGMFAGRSVDSTEYGPRLADYATYAYCSVLETEAQGYVSLVTARLDAVYVHDIETPLSYFRGSYRSLRS